MTSRYQELTDILVDNMPEMTIHGCSNLTAFFPDASKIPYSFADSKVGQTPSLNVLMV